MPITDSSRWFVSWERDAEPGRSAEPPYLYSALARVGSYREELGVRQSTLTPAGIDGGALGESFQGLTRIVADLTLQEDDDASEAGEPLPYRLVVERFRQAHRRGRGKLILHNAANGCPREFVVAAIESIGALQHRAPLNATTTEAVFIVEPERWWDSAINVNLLTSLGAGSWGAAVHYAGPTTAYLADADGLPTISLTVASLDTGRLPDSVNPATVTLSSALTGQSFVLYPDANGAYTIDSYRETVRKASAPLVPYEYARYMDGFLRIPGSHLDAGTNGVISAVADGCSLSAFSLTVYPRHW